MKIGRKQESWKEAEKLVRTVKTGNRKEVEGNRKTGRKWENWKETGKLYLVNPRHADSDHSEAAKPGRRRLDADDRLYRGPLVEDNEHRSVEGHQPVDVVGVDGDDVVLLDVVGRLEICQTIQF